MMEFLLFISGMITYHFLQPFFSHLLKVAITIYNNAKIEIKDTDEDG